MVILDTDHLTLLERGDSAASKRLRKRLADLPPDEPAVTTIITYEEQTRGWLAYMARARGVTQQVAAYQRLRLHVETYRRIPVIDFDDRAAVEFQRLRAARVRVGTMDLKIAAVAIAQDSVLLSRNLADFQKVPGLRVEDWTI
jgi:tRNA(fMet)-specific endonuclease VapC